MVTMDLTLTQRGSLWPLGPHRDVGHGPTGGLFHGLRRGCLGLTTQRTLENHQGQVSDLLYLDQLPAIATDVVEEIADLCSAIALAVVLRKL